MNMLLERKAIELVDKKPIDIGGLFALENDKTKQRLIFKARRSYDYFAELEDPQMNHPRLFRWLQLGKNE